MVCSALEATEVLAQSDMTDQVEGREILPLSQVYWLRPSDRGAVVSFLPAVMDPEQVDETVSICLHDALLTTCSTQREEVVAEQPTQTRMLVIWCVEE